MTGRISILIIFIAFICFILFFLSSIILDNENSRGNSAISSKSNSRNSAVDEVTITSDIILWSSDFHIAPIADIKHLLSQYNVQIIDKSLSSHCHLTNTCAHDLKVIDKDNGINLGDCPNKLRRQFYKTYRVDKEFLSSDAVICTYAFASCVELFMPFNKSIIMVATTRFETGRHDVEAWSRWVETLRRVAANPRNVVAANNRYDQEYVKYFTGIQNVELLPSYCGYVDASYSPRRPQILLGPGRGVHETLIEQASNAAKIANINLSTIRALYPHFEYSDLAAHPAVVLVPYQVSIMTIFELYRMNIPLFVPSPELLVDWHLKYQILSERTWPGVYHSPVRKSVLPRHPESTSAISSYDPNDDFNKGAIIAWIRLADFYIWQNISVFHSWEHLMSLLKTVNLSQISQSMAKFNSQEEENIRRQWSKILLKITKSRRYNQRETKKNETNLPPGINRALTDSYKIKLSRSDCIQTSFS